MPRLTKSLPKYRKHRASGQAVVTLDGRDFYLGPHGTKASKREYDRLVGEWQANGGRLPVESGAPATVTELCSTYWRFCKTYYVKNGRPTDEQPGIKAALRHIKSLYGNTFVRDFGPLALEAVRERMIESGNSRGYINQNVGRVRRMFKWGVAKQLVPVEVYQALMSVDGLRKGKTNARDTAPVLPVAADVVDATLAHCVKVINDMIRFQLLTGARPGELFVLKPRDIDRSGDVWEYRPDSHKMEHKDRHRVILIGPKAQAVLTPYLLRDGKTVCFEKPRGGAFKRGTYRDAIHRACDKAKVERSAPNRLRHSRATDIRSKYGLEASQVILGHSQADTTQIYAERDLAKAARIMREVG